jgi:hypothetical protein
MLRTLRTHSYHRAAIIGVLLGLAALVAPCGAIAQDAPSCLPPVACDRFNQRVQQSAERSSSLAPAQSMRTQDVPADSGHSSRAKHVLTGAAVGAATMVVINHVAPRSCSGSGGDDTQGLCDIARFFADIITTAIATVLGGVVGAFWPTH